MSISSNILKCLWKTATFAMVKYRPHEKLTAFYDNLSGTSKKNNYYKVVTKYWTYLYTISQIVSGKGSWFSGGHHQRAAMCLCLYTSIWAIPMLYKRKNRKSEYWDWKNTSEIKILVAKPISVCQAFRIGLHITLTECLWMEEALSCFIKDSPKKSEFILVFDCRHPSMTWEQKLYHQFK